MNHSYFSSSIGRKQIVAATGLILILFILGHLAGNLFIYFGPEAFNHYAKKLAGLRPFLYLIEFGLLGIFLIHMYFTVLLVLENIKARGQTYRLKKDKGNPAWATKWMAYTGTLILVFVIYHLLDFTFTDHHGPRSMLVDGQSYGLYGVVYNSFLNPLHSFFYIICMIAVGTHLSHGVESFVQTFGFNHPRYTPKILKFSQCFAVVVTLGYSSIPIYIFLKNFNMASGICH
ncbi:MAG: succinate dehydrogenase cytochrome b subunit [Candidatus Omnitrophica bacterium]|nr:succinate dehydrogenase cytochrome b subunit [Candidatus Omnitrophota bacterium]